MDNFINNLVSIYARHLSLSDNEKAILKYGITIATSTILGVVASLSLAALLGNFFHVFIMIVSMMIYRSFSGGGHCSTMLRCTIFSTILVNLLCIFSELLLNFNLINYFYFTIEFLILLFSIWAIYNYAPADTPAKPIKKKEKKEKLKKLSFVYIIVWYCFSISWFYIKADVSKISFYISIGILWQTFSITPLGYKFLNDMDKLFSLFNINHN
ncbi:accessory gene regulator ArgB-like protein [Hathewaya histolytica]|uniref:accessory gene regulator ArgB-like protein n=1 Tax=Hathewaya histolytica TaxID=1498 RepID=UPI003B6747DE